MDSQNATQVSSLGCRPRAIPPGGIDCTTSGSPDLPIMEFVSGLLSFGKTSKQDITTPPASFVASSVVIVPLVIFSIVAIALINRKRKQHKKPLQLQ